MNEMDDDALEMDEPEDFAAPDNIWMRGLWMIVMAIMFGLAQSILGVTALVQWLWMLVTKKKNGLLVEFGDDLGLWMHDVARFQTGVTESKPFPWKRWGA